MKAAPGPRGKTEPRVPGGRATCYRCFRPTTHCYCEGLEPVRNRTEIIILQHPRERFHPIGTARIAALGLERVRVEVDVAGRFSRAREPLGLPPGTGLLYPKAPYRDLATLTPAERPQHLLVLDGTWHHAHTLFRDVPGLSELPRYGFTPEAPSEYRIRREPRAECVSTIEAIAQCLVALEPDTPRIAELIDVFRAMIDRQLEARPDESSGRVLKRQRPEGFRKLPRALTEDFARLVVVYGEWHCPKLESGERELVQWSALRLRSGELFDELITPSQSLAPFLLTCMKLTGSAFEQSLSSSEFSKAWEDFVQPNDVFAAWCPDTARRRTWSNSARLDSCVSLKAAYHALGRHAGPLEDILRKEGLSAEPVACLGRAAQRVANAKTLAELLNALATRI